MIKSGSGQFIRKARYREFFGLIHQILPLAGAAVQITDDIQVDGQSDFLEHAIAATYNSGQVKLRFERVPGMMDSDAPFFIGALGTGIWPHYHPIPLEIMRGTIYRMYADDRQLVGANNNIRVLHIGQKVYDSPFESAKMYTWAEPQKRMADFTAQNPQVGALANGAQGQIPVAVGAEADYDVSKFAVLSDGPVLVDIDTSGKALRWFNKPVHSDLLAGTPIDPPQGLSAGAWPFRLPSPIMIPGSGIINVTVTDLGVSPVYPNRCQVVFYGTRLKPKGGLPIADDQITMIGGAQ